MKNYILKFLCFVSLTCAAQVSYNGNGNSGFGGVIGTGTLDISDDGTTITMEVTRGAADFNDAMVIYIDTATGGRSTIDTDVNDQADDLRRAISSAGSDESVITFPAGFAPEYAIAVDVNFGGLWAIPETGAVGDTELPFEVAVNSTLAATTDASFTMEVDWAALGLTSSDDFDFIAVYLNSGNGFTSDESFGSPIVGGNPGGSNYSLSSFFTYSQTLSSPNIVSNDLELVKINDQLIVKNLNSTATLSIFNMLGQQVVNKDLNGYNNQYIVDLNNKQNGIYIAKIVSERQSWTYKFILD